MILSLGSRAGLYEPVVPYVKGKAQADTVRGESTNPGRPLGGEVWRVDTFDKDPNGT